MSRVLFLNLLWLLGPAALLGGFGMAIHPIVAISLMVLSHLWANYCWLYGHTIVDPAYKS